MNAYYGPIGFVCCLIGMYLGICMTDNWRSASQRRIYEHCIETRTENMYATNDCSYNAPKHITDFCNQLSNPNPPHEEK